MSVTRSSSCATLYARYGTHARTRARARAHTRKQVVQHRNLKRAFRGWQYVVGLPFLSLGDMLAPIHRRPRVFSLLLPHKKQTGGWHQALAGKHGERLLLTTTGCVLRSADPCACTHIARTHTARTHAHTTGALLAALPCIAGPLPPPHGRCASVRAADVGSPRIASSPQKIKLPKIGTRLGGMREWR